MQTTLSKTGGVNIGLMNASWPLARLKASSEKLEITILFLGTYTFHPDDVISIEPYSLFRGLGRGVQIHHSRTDCSKHIVFFHSDSPESLIAQIHDTGFACLSKSEKVGGGKLDFSVRLWVVAALVVVQLLPALYFIPIHIATGRPPPFPTQGQIIYASLTIYLSGTLILFALLKSTTLQELVMKPDRHFGEIKRLLHLLVIIFGVASLVLAVVACFV